MHPAENLFIRGVEGRLSVRTKGLEGRRQAVVILTQWANLSGQPGDDFKFAPDDSYSVMNGLANAGCGALALTP